MASESASIGLNALEELISASADNIRNMKALGNPSPLLGSSSFVPSSLYVHTVALCMIVGLAGHPYAEWKPLVDQLNQMKDQLPAGHALSREAFDPNKKKAAQQKQQVPSPPPPPPPRWCDAVAPCLQRQSG